MSVRGFKIGIRPLAFPGKSRKSPDQANRRRILAQTLRIFVILVGFFDAINKRQRNIFVIYLCTVTIELR